MENSADGFVIKKEDGWDFDEMLSNSLKFYWQ